MAVDARGRAHAAGLSWQEHAPSILCVEKMSKPVGTGFEAFVVTSTRRARASTPVPGSDKAIGDFKLNTRQAAALDAGLTAHEGRHAGTAPGVFALVQMHGERAAFGSESYTYEGLKNTDVVFGLWNESWLELDEAQREQTRRKAIDENRRRKDD